MRFPPPEQVEKVTTTVFGTVSKQPDLAEFEIPSAYVPDVLRVLSPPEYHELPPVHEREVVAVLHVTRRDGRVLVV